MVNEPELVHFSFIKRIIGKCVERIIVVVTVFDCDRSMRVSTCVWMGLWNCVWIWIWNSRRTSIWISLWLRIGIVIAVDSVIDNGDFETFWFMVTARCSSIRFSMPQGATAPLSGEIPVHSYWFNIEMKRVDTKGICAKMIDIMIGGDEIARVVIKKHELVNNDFLAVEIQTFSRITGIVCVDTPSVSVQVPADDTTVSTRMLVDIVHDPFVDHVHHGLELMRLLVVLIDRRTWAHVVLFKYTALMMWDTFPVVKIHLFEFCRRS